MWLNVTLYGLANLVEVVRNSYMEVCKSGVSGCIYCVFGLSPVTEPKLVAHVNWQCSGTGLERAGPWSRGINWWH